MRATRFRRAALFAERLVGTGKKVKGREIDVAPWFCTGPCASKAANHWQATAPRRAPVAPRWRRVRDSNPRRTCILNGFQDRRVQPLRQLSISCSSPRSFRCAPLAQRLAKSFFLASPRMLMVRSPCAALHSLGDSPNLTIRQSLNLSICQSLNPSITSSSPGLGSRESSSRAPRSSP